MYNSKTVDEAACDCHPVDGVLQNQTSQTTFVGLVGLVDGAPLTQHPANETVVGAVGEGMHKPDLTVKLLQMLLERDYLEAGG